MRLSPNSHEKGVGLPTAEQELLLKAAVGGADVALTAWKTWRQGNELNALTSDSRRLLPLIGHNMRHHGIALLEQDTIAAMTRLAWAKSKMLFKTFGEVERFFAANGIDVLFIKGLPVALQHYPTPSLRQMNDGDILIRPHQFDQTIELLRSAGWQYAQDDEPSPAQHAIPFINGNGQEIDVHRFALGECPFSEEDEDLWKLAISLPFEGTTIRIPNPTQVLLMACVNSVHSPIRWVADAVFLLRNGQINWPLFVEQARKRKVTFVTTVALSYVAQHYSASVPASALRELEASRSSWLEKREYAAWDHTDSQLARFLIRYASYRRIKGAQNPVGFLNHLRFYGNLNSIQEIPLWLVRGARPKSDPNADGKPK